jgi:hypothetical protein
VRLEIFVDGTWTAEADCDVRLEKGDQILVPSKARCGPGMEPELVVAEVMTVRHNFFKGVTTVTSKRVED